jgi:hypothetical protein
MEVITMKRVMNGITIIICLAIGFIIGYTVPKTDKAEIDNVISSTNETEYFNSQVEFYDDIITDINAVQIYETNELTYDMLINRNGKIIIEKVIGKVENDNLDGKILNCIDEEHDYICYKRVDGVKKGNVVLTYFIYNPYTSYTDDVLTRIDFIIDGCTI